MNGPSKGSKRMTATAPWFRVLDVSAQTFLGFDPGRTKRAGG
ncbi:hypothetical protein SNOG_02798 [Parastagonospora nodorum SN15]|uniref:Uncharacterized protein n=1 Tax=Phaeosphaeria nodorum (strain SN15 / ATCC MYA-4574 / FGSC 10173) TaxID=321614 RepID=Q0UZL6_PHANO|nr:hypothetical protein SNOG_02798 [Parastagonospora nodorum SN15]EAT89529.1 hypothetical protein SNOG_02798 [Parastagonospora nodorum SN15]